MANSLNIVNINVDLCQYWRPLPTVHSVVAVPEPMSVLETTTHCAMGLVVAVPEPMSVLETTTHCALGSVVAVPEPLITADLSSWLQSPAQRPAGGGNQFDQSCTGCRLTG